MPAVHWGRFLCHNNRSSLRVSTGAHWCPLLQGWARLVLGSPGNPPASAWTGSRGARSWRCWTPPRASAAAAAPRASASTCSSPAGRGCMGRYAWATGGTNHGLSCRPWGGRDYKDKEKNWFIKRQKLFPIGKWVGNKQDRGMTLGREIWR